MWNLSQDWLTTGVQVLLLGGPAWLLGGRRFLPAVLWVAILAQAGFLLCWWLGIYTWTVAGSVHVALVLLAALARLATRRYFGGPAGTGIPEAGVAPRPATAAAFDGPPPTGSSRDVRVLFALTWACVLVGLGMNLRTPPGGWDALTYHLDFPLQWVSAGRIFTPPLAYGDLSPAYYPWLTEAVYGWLLLPGRGPGLADLAQLLWLGALYAALRELVHLYQKFTGGPIEELIPLVAVLSPYWQSSALVADNDVVLCAWLACAWLGGARLAGARDVGERRRAALFFGAALGCALATKYTGLVYAGALGVVLICLHGMRPLVRHATLWVPTMLVCGGMWYGKNLMLTGNPLYPAELSVFGVHLFSGYYPAAFFAEHPFHDFSLYGFMTDAGFLVSIAAALGAPIVVLARGRVPAAAERRVTIALSFAPLVFFLAYYFLIPLRQHRLALPAQVPACLALLVCVDGLAHIRGLPRGLEELPRRLLLLGAVGFALLWAARCAELYTSLWRPSINLTEFSRATMLVLGRDPFGAFSFAALIGLVAVLLYVLRPGRPGAAPVYAGRAVWGRAGLWAAAASVAFGLSLERAPYSGGELPAAWEYLRALPAPRTSALPDADATDGIGVIGTNALTPLRPARVELLTGTDPRAPHERAARLWRAPQGWREAGPGPDAARLAARFQQARVRRILISRTGPVWPVEREWLRALLGMARSLPETSESRWTNTRQGPTVEIYEYRSEP